MSIVALKRKTNTLYNNQSVGSENGFSISGTHRNMSYIGQSLASRNLERKYIRGASTGGCCGQLNNPYQSNNMCCVNDNTVIKRTSMNTTSYLINKKNKYVRPVVKKYDNTCANRLNRLYIDLVNEDIIPKQSSSSCSASLKPYFTRHYSHIQNRTAECNTTQKMENNYEDLLNKIKNGCLKTKCGVGNYYVSSNMRAPLPGNSKL